MSDFVKRLREAAAHLPTNKVSGAMRKAKTSLGKWASKIGDQAKKLFPHAGRD